MTPSGSRLLAVLAIALVAGCSSAPKDCGNDPQKVCLTSISAACGYCAPEWDPAHCEAERSTMTAAHDEWVRCTEAQNA